MKNDILLFKHLLFYDIKCSLKKYWLLMFFSFFLVILCCLYLYNKYSFYEIYSQDLLIPWKDQSLTFGDYFVFVFKGMDIFIEDFSILKIDSLYLFISLFVSYLTMVYPLKDLNGFGAQVLIRSQKRYLWWIAKCCWCCLIIIIYYCFIYLVIFITCLILSGSLSLLPTDNLKVILESHTYIPMSLTFTDFIRPIITLISFSALQLFLILIIGPIISYLITIIHLVSSIFVYHPMFLGNYLMILRNNSTYQIQNWLLIVVLITVFSYIGGVLLFHKFDCQINEGGII